ncbi:MAG: hypothetical protein JO352_04855 [Chloroflexi bacterium]|nr:hypothetical protein [Chloroflexota bacterium]MBV9600699.1 hypothetical protein [Chloroflexota bacterium]
MYVLGFEFEQLGQRVRHGLKAATEVQPHGVLRWRRRDDHVGVAGGAGGLLKLPISIARNGALTWRNASWAIPGPKVWHATPTPTSRPLARAPSATPPFVDVLLEFVHLGLDGVFAVPASRVVELPCRATS